MTVASDLMKLQDLDLELLKCASSLASMPQQARLKTIGLAAKKVRSELTSIVGQRKDAELELADTRAERYYFDEPFGVKTALVMGSERYGISRAWYEGDYRMIAIPMEGSCDSLNVGVAGGILMHMASCQK